MQPVLYNEFVFYDVKIIALFVLSKSYNGGGTILFLHLRYMTTIILKKKEDKILKKYVIIVD